MNSASLAALVLGVTVTLSNHLCAQTLTPVVASLDPALIGRLKDGFQEMVDSGQRGGIAWGIAKDGEVVALDAVGHRDRGEGLPMETDTIFRIYSMTRAVSAVALLTLVEQGRISLDAPVPDYIPALAEPDVVALDSDGNIGTEPARRAPTVRDLLTYTAGYAYAPQYPEVFGVDHRDILALDQTISQGMEKLGVYPLRDQPGARWRYGYHSDVIGRLIEIGSGRRVDDYIRESILDPLGMHDSGFHVDAGDHHRLTRAYGDGGGDITDNLPPSSDWFAPADFQSAGGGMVSTVPDWMRFAEMLRRGGELEGVRILSEGTVAEMTTNQLTPEQGPLFWYDGADTGQPGFSGPLAGYGWGYGIGVRLPEGPHNVPGSAGEITWGGLANTTWFADRQHKITAVVFAQYLGERAATTGELMRRVLYPDYPGYPEYPDDPE
jgi:CubicO group peptidase (beta-lactamase class C family)